MKTEEVNHVREREIHASEPLVGKHSFEVEVAAEKLKRYYSNSGRIDVSRM
jgi:hypothetical protein